MIDGLRRALLFVATLALVSTAAQAKQDKRDNGSPEDGSYTLGRVEWVDPSLKAGEPLADPATLRAVGFTAERDHLVIPKGSADYSKMLALVERYKKKEITFDELQKRVVAEKLPPHGLGDEYLVAPVPPPPPGVPYDPGMMPPDWAHTFGEVTMTFWVGKLTRDEYDRLHKAAHGKLPGFPNCHRAP